MKKIFQTDNPKIIEALLSDVEYATLALCANDKPYAFAVNFVKVEDAIYFHGAQKGKKVELLQQNPYASMSVVKPYSIIPSYFSTTDALACPATQFFASLVIDGAIVFVQDYEEKVQALEALMQKLQSEGKYTPLDDKVYEKIVHATCVYKLISLNISAKLKFGQNLSKERFEMIVEHLQKRATPQDRKTLEMMQSYVK